MSYAVLRIGAYRFGQLHSMAGKLILVLRQLQGRIEGRPHENRNRNNFHKTKIDQLLEDPRETFVISGLFHQRMDACILAPK